MSGIRFHEAAALLPLLEGEDFMALVEDIRANKQLEPIRRLNGRILDGRNRYRACETLGIEPRYDDLPGDTDAVAYVLSSNLHRRHLNESQRAMLAARLLDDEKAAAKKRQRAAGGDKKNSRRKKTVLANLPEPVEKGTARAQAAKKTNVSPRSVAHAARVLADGAKPLIEAVERGAIAVSRAAQLVHLPKQKQIASLDGGKEGIRKAIQHRGATSSPSSFAVRGAFHRVAKELEELAARTGGACAALASEAWRHEENKSLVALVQRAQRDLAEWETALLVGCSATNDGAQDDAPEAAVEHGDPMSSRPSPRSIHERR